MAIVSRRSGKRLLYAALLLAVLIAAVWLIVVIARVPHREPKASPTSTPTFADIIQEDVAVLPYQNSSGQTLIDVIVQLRNPNARAGVSDYPVDMKVLSTSGKQLLTHRETTHLVPGALQYVLAVGLEIPRGQQLGQVEITRPAEPNFQELPGDVPLPSFSTFLRERTSRQINSETIDTQTGLVKNTGTFDWQKVEVVAVALDSNRQVIAAGKTFLGRLLSGEQREFTVQWTQPQQPIAQVVVLPSTDMFGEENIVEILGDPSKLR